MQASAVRIVPLAFSLSLWGLVPLAAQRLPDPRDGSREVHLHDVRSVLAAIGDPSEADEGAAARKLDDLVALARGLIRPRLENPAWLQRLGDDLLVLRGSPEQQISLRELLAALGEGEGVRVEVTFELIEVPRADLRAILARCAKAAPQAMESARAFALDREGAGRLREAIAAARGARTLHAPRLHVNAVRGATFEIGNVLLYRKDWRPEKHGDRVKLWPVTGEVKDGLWVQVRAAPVAADAVGVVVRAKVTEVDRPVVEFETEVAGRPVVVDLPEIHRRLLSGELRVPRDGLGVCVGGGEDDARRWLLLVRARVTE